MIHVDCELVSVVRKMIMISVRCLHTVDLAACAESHEVIVAISKIPLVFTLFPLGFDHNSWQLVRCKNEWYSEKHCAWVLVFGFYDKTLSFKR